MCKSKEKKNEKTSLLLLLQTIWCNANRYLPWLWNLFLTDHVIALSTESLVSALALSLKSHLFNLQLFQVSRRLSVLISCCCSARPKSHVNLYLVITLVNTRRIWKLGKSPLLSCLWQLGYVLLRCVLIFRSPPCLLLTLWLPLFAIPPSHGARSYATKFVPRENYCGLYVQ